MCLQWHQLQKDFKIVNLPVSHNASYFTLNSIDRVLSRQNSIAEKKAYHLIEHLWKNKDDSSVKYMCNNSVTFKLIISICFKGGFLETTSLSQCRDMAYLARCTSD